MAKRFERTDCGDGASEILAVVEVDRDGTPLGRYVEVCAGPEIGDDFVGLYDFDGERVDLGNCEWAAVEPTRREVREIHANWEGYNQTVRAIRAKAPA